MDDQTRVIRSSEPGPPRRRRPGLWPVALAAIVLVGLGLGALLAVALDDDEPAATGEALTLATSAEETTTAAEETTTEEEPEPVELPDLVGTDQGSATSQLDELGLRYSIAEVPSDEEPGVVVSQNPAAGTVLEEGDGVHLNVSRGREPAGTEVPAVVGMQEKDAERALKGSGFETDKQEETVDDPAQHKVVLSQQPGGGERAEPGSTVVIVVGRRGGGDD